MENHFISWYGDLHLKNSIATKVGQMIQECTSEQAGLVRVQVVLGENSCPINEKIPVICNDRLYLAFLEINFVLFVEIGFLNIKEMIFMYDNEIVDSSVLPVNLANFL